MNRKHINQAIITRTREARERVFEDQKDMAKALGIEYGTYNKYETRTPLPHGLIAKFCAVSGISIEFFITGQENPLCTAYHAASPDDRRLTDKILGLEKNHDSLTLSPHVPKRAYQSDVSTNG